MSKPSSLSLPKDLIASHLANDERVQQAKKLLQEALQDHQKEIKTIKPPKTALKQSYDEMLKDFADLRGGKLWYPYIGSGLGNGALVELADGSVKYDFICGIGVHCMGHSPAFLLSAEIDAALSNTIMQGHLQQNFDSLQLSQLLTKVSGLPHCFLTTSGAIANDNALKIAFQKNFPANRVLAFTGCFAGRSVATSQITDKPGFREGIPTTLAVDYLPFFNPKHPEESTKRTLAQLKTYLKRYPKQHALMCFEFIQGEGGFHVGEKAFFTAIMDLLKENHIAIFADEVQSFARTSEPFAFQYFGLQSYVDIASMGKASQVCATFFTEEYKPRVGLLSQTFTGSTSAIKASYAIIKHLLEGNYFGAHGKNATVHNYFAEKLRQLNHKHPHLIEGPYGIGCMVAFTPYQGDTKKVTDFTNRLFDAGVISFIAGGGEHPSRVRFLLPIGAITFDDIDQVVKIIEQTLLTGQ